MFVELAASIMLIFMRPDGVELWVTIVGLCLAATVWLSTFALQVPQHRVLEAGFDVRAHRRLVTSNWVRTVAWSLRALIVVHVHAHVSS